ncbi:hypothetical protein CASFOL_019711 [Castilleja foliolosa]|uniref:Uncharacterized protein n=1 Tax=Castilleja foliolosa TaxID=1961234 RepID=A0ABD3D1H9_9LAMI
MSPSFTAAQDPVVWCFGSAEIHGGWRVFHENWKIPSGLRFWSSLAAAAEAASTSDGLTVERIIANNWVIYDESESDWKSHASSIARSIHLIKKRLRVEKINTKAGALKKIKLSSSQIEADNLVATVLGEAVPSKKVKVSSSQLESGNTGAAVTNEADQISFRGWKCGLSKNNARQMKALRAKYAAAILESEINLHRVRVLSEAKKYYAEKVGSEPIGVDQPLVVRAAGEPL